MIFSSYGVRIGIRVSQADLTELIRPVLPPALQTSSDPVVDHLYSLRAGAESRRRGIRHFHQLHLGAVRLTRSLDLGEVVQTLEDHLRLLVAALAPRHVFVHAGVVGWNGRAIVLPGPSHCGKTTLVAELLRAGAAYYSDEYAVLDDRGLVHPYACLLSLRDRASHACTRRSAAELGSLAGSTPLPVGLVLATRYDPNGRWRPQRLSAGEAAMRLVENAVAARIAPERMLKTLARVSKAAATLQTARGDAAEAARHILTAADAIHPDPPSLEVTT